jgi:hypothetical protein
MFLLIVLLAMLEQVWTDYSSAKLEMKMMKNTLATERSGCLTQCEEIQNYFSVA